MSEKRVLFTRHEIERLIGAYDDLVNAVSDWVSLSNTRDAYDDVRIVLTEMGFYDD